MTTAERISDLETLTSSAAGDYFATVDVSDTSFTSTGETKKITRANLFGQDLTTSDNVEFAEVTSAHIVTDSITAALSDIAITPDVSFDAVVNLADASNLFSVVDDGGGVVFQVSGDSTATAQISMYANEITAANASYLSQMDQAVSTTSDPTFNDLHLDGILYFDDATLGRIAMSDSDALVISYDNTADATLNLYSTYSSTRAYSTKIRCYGAGTASFAEYLDAGHNGTEGFVDGGLGLILKTDNTSAVYIDQSQNVGIGVSPSNRFEVKSSGTLSDVLNILKSGSANQLFAINEGASSEAILELYDANNDLDVRFHTAGYSYVNSGNFGVGTTIPNYPVEIRGDSGDILGIASSAGLSTHDALINFQVNRGYAGYEGSAPILSSSAVVVKSDDNIEILTTGATSLVMGTNTTQAFIIDSSQNTTISGDTTTIKNLAGNQMWRLTTSGANPTVTIGSSSSSDATLTLRSSNTSSPSITFNDSAGERGIIGYNHNTPALTIGTEGTTAITVNSVQNTTFAGSITVDTTVDDIFIDVLNASNQDRGFILERQGGSNHRAEYSLKSSGAGVFYGSVQFYNGTSLYECINFEEDDLSFLINGSEAVNINSSGNAIFNGKVGIGISTPATDNLLHVFGGSARVEWDQNGETEIRIRNDTDGTAAGSKLVLTADGINLQIGCFATSHSSKALENWIYTSSNDPIIISNDGSTENIRIDTNDRVTIVDELDVPVIGTLTSNGGGFQINAEDDIVFTCGAYGSETERMRLKEIGRLGVGENNPDTLIHATGDTNQAITLQVTDSLAAAQIRAWASHDGTTSTNGDAVLQLALKTGAVASTPDTCWYIGSDGRTGADSFSPFLKIGFVADDTWGRPGDADLVVIDSTGHVLIGDTVTPSDYRGNFTIECADNEGMTLVANGTTFKSNIYFGDGSDSTANSRGQVAYDHNIDELSFVTANTTALTIASDQSVSLNGTLYATTIDGVSTQLLLNSDDSILLQWNSIDYLTIDNSAFVKMHKMPLFEVSATPSTASATGTAGQFTWDGSYFYICTATNTWRRAAHSTW